MHIMQTLDSPSLSEWRQLLEELYHHRKLWNFTKGQSIPMEETDVWVVCRGVVQISTLYKSGDEGILSLCCPSMPFGLPLTLVNPYEAKALSDVVLMRLHQMELEQSPRLAQSLFRELNRRMQQTEALLAMSGCKRVKERLRQLISLLQQEFGHVTSEGIKLSVKLTHQQLANMIGTTRVTVTRLINELKDEGIAI